MPEQYSAMKPKAKSEDVRCKLRIILRYSTAILNSTINMFMIRLEENVASSIQNGANSVLDTPYTVKPSRGCLPLQKLNLLILLGGYRLDFEWTFDFN